MDYPHPRTGRTNFLNKNALNLFNKSQWKFSQNAKDFSKLFHSKGRREYDLRIELEDFGRKGLTTITVYSRLVVLVNQGSKIRENPGTVHP